MHSGDGDGNAPAGGAWIETQKKHTIKNGKIYFFSSKSFDVYEKYQFNRAGQQILLPGQNYLLPLLSDGDRDCLLSAINYVFKTELPTRVQYNKGEPFMALVKMPSIRVYGDANIVVIHELCTKKSVDATNKCLAAIQNGERVIVALNKYLSSD